jgi:hypothetical protein
MYSVFYYRLLTNDEGKKWYSIVKMINYYY